MSMSTRVVGFQPADETWNKMAKVWETCEAANIQIPTEVVNFFQGDPPGDRPGQEVNIKAAVKVYKNGDHMEEGYDVDVTALPKNVKLIRFVNSY